MKKAMWKQAAEEPPKPDGIVIFLRCQDVEELRIRVRPSTKISKIMRGFQSQRQIDKSKTCYLVFDGERLDENTTVQAAEFEDECVVEVHPR